MSKLSRLNPNFIPPFDGFKIATELIGKLKPNLQICEAILFGSCVDSRNTIDSDLDLLVTIPDHSDVKEYYKFVNTPFFSPVAVDWIFMTESEFKIKKEIGGIAMVADQTGKRIV